MTAKYLTITKFSVLALAFGLSILAAQAQRLRGGVSEEDLLRQQGPTLNRNDIQHGGDPFRNGNSDPVDQLLEAPPGASDMNSLRAPAPPKKPFNLQADDQGADFGGQSMPAQEDQMPQQPMQQAPPRGPMQGSAMTPRNNEPDSSAEMQLLWDAWHKRVAETIFTRFNSLAQMAFKHSPPLACEVSYAVSRDGQIGNVAVLQKSSSPMFNAMLLGVVKSMNGNPVLQFPPGSRRQYVEKTGTFTWNYGQQGFKYAVGDQERVKQPAGQGQRPMQQPMQNFNQNQGQFNPMQQMQQQMQQPMQNFNQNQQMQPMQQMRQQQFNPMQMMQQMMH